MTEFLSSPEMVATFIGAILAAPFTYLGIRREQKRRNNEYDHFYDELRDLMDPQDDDRPDR